MNKQQNIQKQSYIKNTIDPAAYAPVYFNNPNNEKAINLCNNLILPENKNYVNITDIKSQILAVTHTEVLKNLVLIQAIYNYVLRQEKNSKQLLGDNYIENSESKRSSCWISRKNQLQILCLFFHSKLTRREISNDLFIPYSIVAKCIQRFNRNDKFIYDVFKPIHFHTQMTVSSRTSLEVYPWANFSIYFHRC